MKRKGASASDFLPWYRDGLHFECTGCGGCCTGADGYVWLTEREIVAIADYLRLDLDTFGKQFLRRVGRSRFSLLEDRRSGDCIFLEEKRCSIYSVRPKQCRTFPFWHDNLASTGNWRSTARGCEGISDDAPLITYRQIEELLY